MLLLIKMLLIKGMPELRGRHLFPAFEDPHKMLGIMVPHLAGDLNNRQIRLDQQGFCLINPVFDDPLLNS